MPDANTTDTEYPPVEVDVYKANSASLALGSLATSLMDTDHPLGSSLETFAEQYGEHRVNADTDDETNTAVLHMSPEGYRLIAGCVRLEALRRNIGQTDDGPTPMDVMLADDNREVARMFDRAAETAEQKMEENTTHG